MNRLFSHIQIGNLELKNRIVLLAMHLGYAENGFVNDQMIRFYQKRARGGVGMIIVGGAYVDRLGIGGINFLAIDEDKYIPGLKKLNDAIHADGAKTAVQLFHAGRYAYSMLIGEQPVSSSEVRSQLSGDTPRALSVEEIQQVTGCFTEGARRAREAGYDAVELSGATGYLVSQFLSPFTNQRTDQYGGNPQNRMRFAVEIVQAIKREVGNDYPIIFRLSFDDLVEGGNGRKETKEIAKVLEQAGVDAFDMQVGWHESKIPTVAMLVPRAAFSYLSREIKREVTVPVVVTNRINDPALAEELLKDGIADMVGMGRPLIADPELPQKAMDERLQELRPCIACNQGCLDSILTGRPVTCLVNPAAGREEVFESKPSEMSKKVMVIGSGPAGIEAARVLSERGHKVALFEKEDRLGGKLNLCHLPPGRKEFKTYLDYLTGKLERLKVDVVKNVEVTKEMVVEISPDVVVIATGSTQLIPQIPGIERPHVYLAESVLKGKAELGEKVVVIGGGAVGCETALFIACKGAMSPSTAFFLLSNGVLCFEEAVDQRKRERFVTIVEMMDRIGADLGRSYRWVIKQNLSRQNVTMMDNTECLKIDEGRVVVKNEGQRQTIDADTVVIATGYSPTNKLYAQLKGKLPELVIIGDAKEPRNCLEAVYEGTKFGKEI